MFTLFPHLEIGGKNKMTSQNKCEGRINFKNVKCAQETVKCHLYMNQFTLHTRLRAKIL